MILPEDIEKQQFEVSFRGYNTREVDEFLNRILTDLEEILAEQDSLKRKIAAAELIAKDAKDHEEEFIASMQEDKNKSDAALAAAKAEGERIIREAKNAAAGIMAEVRRRASDISAESRKASNDIIESAKAEADELRTTAKTDADEVISAAKADATRITNEANDKASKKLFSARTEAENILRAAQTEANATLNDARETAARVTKTAADSAAVHEKYIKEVRSAAEKLCFEIDTELKNSAARIALLGRRISSVDLPEKAEIPKNEEPDAAYSAPAHASNETETAPAEEDTSKGGYFSHEYRQAMTELFGEDADTKIPDNAAEEDDDTYDYVDQHQTAGNRFGFAYETEDEAADGEDLYGQDDEDGDFDDDDAVTSEYPGIPTASKNNDLQDIFSDDALDRVYKSPSKEDIDDILNGQ